MNSAQLTTMPDLRAKAATAWRTHGWPAQKLEAWRHTSLRGFTQVADGAHSPGVWGTSGDEQVGVEVTQLGPALQNGHAAVARWLGRVASIDRPEDALSARNLAEFTGGALVHVRRDQKIEHLIDLSFPGHAEPLSLVQRLLIVVEPHSEAAVLVDVGALDRGQGDDASPVGYARNLVIEVALGVGAHLNLVVDQRESSLASSIITLAVTQRRDSRLQGHMLQTGARLGRIDATVRLAEPGACCSIDGLYVSDGRQHHDNNLVVHHDAGHTDSAMLYKGVLGGQSTGVFRGNVLIHRGASKSTTTQLNRNLLLSAGATVNAKPQLEIDNDDVKASHGATIGELDEQALFYLCSRGIAPALARSMLTWAFVSEVVQRVPVASVRAHLVSLLAADVVAAD